MKSNFSSYNKWGFYIFVITTVLSTIWVLYYLVINNSINLAELPSEKDPNLAVQIGDKDYLDKPWVSQKQAIVYGAKVYKMHCAVCHGAKGLGDGTPGLNPPPKNLVEGKWSQGGSSKELFITLQKGIAGTSMVSFQHLSKSDRWALVHYIRSITKNKIVDDVKELESFGKNSL